MKLIVVNLRHEPCDIRICRPSPYGNPFRIGAHGTREDVVAKYKGWLADHPGLVGQLLQACLALQRAGKETIRLGCWCFPLACHGDVLKEAVEALMRGGG